MTRAPFPGRPCDGIGPDHAHSPDCWGPDETGTRYTDYCYACWLAYWTGKAATA